MLGAAIVFTALVSGFNLVLDARLRADRDNLLHERAATVLRGLGTVDGQLRVIEAPDQAAIDAQTWIFDGERAVEQPANADPRNQDAAVELARQGSGVQTVDTTHTRLAATTVRQAGRRLGTVVVGTSERPYESSASAALTGSIILGVLTLVAVAALSLWLIGRALRPVARMTKEAAEWDQHDSARRFFAGKPDDELTSLASVFDGLLSRVAQSLRHEQTLTAEISHELRTPLAKIVAEAELATRHGHQGQQHQTSLEMILGYAQELRRVLETLLASARTCTSDHVPSSDARAAARRAIYALEQSAAGQTKEIELECAGSLFVAVDGDVLERMLAPPLENAARFAYKRISVTVTEETGNVIFAIQDDGPGVASGNHERIFEPGFRGADAATSRHDGAGLGLALARRLARAAGGEVEAHASREGALFVLSLPASATPPPN